MVPFAIAGVQMPVPALHDNVPAMIHKIDVAVARFPWVQMVLFSELASCGPLPKDPPSLPSEGSVHGRGVISPSRSV
jgi:deaminated glutathione amidase